MKTAVVYFSRAGENYVAGDIVSLKEGNSKLAALEIARLLQAESFELKTKQSYPAAYRACTEQAKRELQHNARPELDACVDPSPFELIVLCYPCWWGTFPCAVATFLESADFSGKTILPVCTHEGSGMGHSEGDLAALCPGAKILRGLPLQGSRCQGGGAAGQIEKHLKRCGLL